MFKMPDLKASSYHKFLKLLDHALTDLTLADQSCDEEDPTQVLKKLSRDPY